MNKKYLLEINDLVSNFFIILGRNNYDVKEITYANLHEFGNIIREEAAKKGMEIVLNLRSDLTTNFLANYSQYCKESKNHKSIILNDGVTPLHLIWFLRLYSPLDVITLMQDEQLEARTLKILNLKPSEEKNPFDVDKYIDQTLLMIAEASSRMDFDKCNELKEQYSDLLYIADSCKEQEKEITRQHIK